MMNYKEITEAIIEAAFEAHNILGYGFLEKDKARHAVEMEPSLRVSYEGTIVGEYAADLMVDGKVIVELKVAKEYNPADEPQLLNELKATEMQVGMLVNFGKEKVEFNRFIYSHLNFESAFHLRSSVAKFFSLAAPLPPCV